MKDRWIYAAVFLFYRFMSKENQIAYSILGVLSIIFYWVAFSQNGLGKSGDSVQHFIMSRHSWNYSQYFFDHWGKPFFTLISSPFSQFGFTGIKFFNVTLALLSTFVTYKSASKLKIEHSYLVIITTLLSTYFLFKMFSGLTEYLSAFMLISSVYLVLNKRQDVAALIVSFLPFVRSEGLVIILVFLFYFMVKANFRSALFLSVGHIVYSVVGYFWYGDILWVFTKIPYATLSTIYGEGTWSHYFHRYMYIAGIPIYILIIAGILQFVFRLFKARFNLKVLFSEHTLLIYGVFAAFFMAHVIFWALSIFNSMGLVRVFITVTPLTGIIALEGLNFFTGLIKKEMVRRSVFYLYTVYMVIFPLTSNHAAPDIPEDFRLESKYVQLRKYLENRRGELAGHKVFASDPHVYLFLDRRVEDMIGSFPVEYYKDPEILKKGDYVIWDHWYTPVQENIELKDPRSSKRLQLINTLEEDDSVLFAIFVAL